MERFSKEWFGVVFSALSGTAKESMMTEPDLVSAAMKIADETVVQVNEAQKKKPHERY